MNTTNTPLGFFEEERGRKRKKVRVGEGKFLTFVFFFRRK